MTSPLRVSSPAARMLSPRCGTFFSSNSSPHPEVFSTITTASAPSGMTPPVKILMAWPSSTRIFAGRPAGASSTTSKTSPASASSLRSAYPSTAELSKGGESVVAVRSHASTSPRASPRGVSSTGSLGVLSNTSRSASGYSISFSKSCTFTPRLTCSSPADTLPHSSLLRQQRHSPAWSPGRASDLDRHEDEVGATHRQLAKVGQDLDVAHPAAQPLLVNRHTVVGASDTGGVDAYGLHAALVKVDSGLRSRSRPARSLTCDERVVHVSLALFALDVVAVPARRKEHDLASPERSMLLFPAANWSAVMKGLTPGSPSPARKRTSTTIAGPISSSSGT